MKTVINKKYITLLKYGDTNICISTLVFEKLMYNIHIRSFPIAQNVTAILHLTNSAINITVNTQNYWSIFMNYSIAHLTTVIAMFRIRNNVILQKVINKRNQG